MIEVLRLSFMRETERFGHAGNLMRRQRAGAQAEFLAAVMQ